jgi:hypothetical protein
MKFTTERIEQGLRELGLSDVTAREHLSALCRLNQPIERPKYETITVAHTSLESKERENAKLESNP